MSRLHEMRKKAKRLYDMSDALEESRIALKDVERRFAMQEDEQMDLLKRERDLQSQYHMAVREATRVRESIRAEESRIRTIKLEREERVHAEAVRRRGAR